MFREHLVLLSSLPPTRRQEHLALCIAGLCFAGFLAVVPFSEIRLARDDAFIPIVDTILFMSDLITAALLYAQFAVGRSRGLLALATGYLSTALIIVPHLLTFPGAFSASGLLGAGPQSTVWLYIAWHLGIPLAVIAYALLKGKSKQKPTEGGSARISILGSVVAAVVLTCSVTWLVTAGVDHLPIIMFDSIHANTLWRNQLAPPIVALNLASLILLWVRRSSLLDVWLLVVLWAWFIETALLSTTSYRFSLVWYAGRAFGLMASILVLLVLLFESTMLYARLALSVAAQNRERESRRTAIETIVGSMAHELRQPLCAIELNGDVAAVQLSQSPADIDIVRASLNDILAQGRRASEIVKTTLRFIRGTSPRRDLHRVDDIVREALTLLQMERRIHSVSLQLDLAPQLPQVPVNQGQLVQVLVNLMSNAIDSMSGVADRPRLLTVRSAAQAVDTVSIEIEDSGAGIAPENMTRIFDPFFTTKSHGTGLGLQICRSIIEEHGGQLTASAGARHGCIFAISLPQVPHTKRPQ